ncbi:hypothetical protein MSAN_01739500 [Mycena sanguinolenta]|uniref:F-box domain-containing protein n=1 Tax=Mycena sanguinolenta TaxID=230812 RepID=A0A8H6Y086_9AGAR|nr:hypothetical protein MSAN_01739500 [Mycena sanguinolenta]
MSITLLLSDLPADIIFSVFACCDIASVVSVGQTCCALHTLALEKSVWLVLLDDLRRRCIFDRNCTPNLEMLSTAEMIEVVKRLLIEPQTWSPTEHNSVAEISRTITLHPKITTEHSYWNVPELLRSGRYVLFINSYRLKCWSAVDDRLVWTHISSMDNMKVYGFATEEADAEITIIVCFTARLNNELENYVEIVDLDLQTGTHISLLVARVPDYGHMNTNMLSEPAICGAFAAVRSSVGWGDLYMVVNWREKLYLVLQSELEAELHGALIPGHILLGDEELYLISSPTLSPYWAPTIAPDFPAEFLPVSRKDIPKLRPLEASHAEQGFIRLYAHESPIRDGHYFVWIYGAHSLHHRDTFLSYRLSILTNEEPQWSPRSGPLERGLTHAYYPITYGGHSIASGTSHERAVFTVFSAASASPEIQVDLPPSAALRIDIAPYSGALTHSTDSSVVIQYYK